MNFGERLHQLRIEKDETLEQVGKAVGVSKQYISNIENGHKTPGKVVINSLADHFGVDIDYMYGKTEVRNSLNLDGIFKAGFDEAVRKIGKAKKIPLYSCLSCGSGVWVDETPMDIISLPEYFAPSGECFCNPADGDSMAPLIEPGALLIFQKVDSLDSGSIGAFALNGSYYCKRFRKLPDGSVWLVSENPKYDPIAVKPEDNFRILGKYRVKISRAQ